MKIKIVNSHPSSINSSIIIEGRQSLIILFNSGCYSTIFIGKIASKVKLKKYIATTWKTQLGGFTTPENFKAG